MGSHPRPRPQIILTSDDIGGMRGAREKYGIPDRLNSFWALQYIIWKDQLDAVRKVTMRDKYPEEFRDDQKQFRKKACDLYQNLLEYSKTKDRNGSAYKDLE